MAENHCSSDKQLAPDSGQESAMSERERAAQRLPFFLRAWWLRDFQESADLVWPRPAKVTGALWSTHSDPLADSSQDYPDDL